MGNRGGYLRSGSGQKDTELGLRTDITKGVGITTTIKSMSGPEEIAAGQSRKFTRCGSGKALRWNERERDLKDDSSEEFLPVQRPNGEWVGVRKTTEVKTTREASFGKAGRSGPTNL